MSKISLRVRKVPSYHPSLNQIDYAIQLDRPGHENETAGTILLKFLVVKDRASFSPPPTLKRQHSLPRLRSETTIGSSDIQPSVNKASLFGSGFLLKGGSQVPLSSSAPSYSAGRYDNHFRYFTPIQTIPIKNTPRSFQAYSFA